MYKWGKAWTGGAWEKGRTYAAVVRFRVPIPRGLRRAQAAVK
jgi:hypothetical protein